ncbi:MAG: tetratricopeptide repeat protein [bacterium]
MYGKTKLSKRQIKEDKFTVFMLTARNQVLDNWQYLALGLIVVVLAIAGIVYYFNSQQTQREEAATQLARAMLDYRAGNNQVAVMGLNQVVQEFGGDQVAEQATFMLGSINYEIRNYPEAISHFEAYLSHYPDNRFYRAASQAGIASCLETQGQNRQAAEKFAAACAEYLDGPLAAEYNMSAMRNYLDAGEIDQARTHLQTLQDDFAGSDLVNWAIRVFHEKSPG